MDVDKNAILLDLLVRLKAEITSEVRIDINTLRGEITSELKNEALVTDNTFADMRSRIIGVEDKTGQLENKTGQLQGKTDELEGKTDELQDKMGQLEDKMGQLEDGMSEFKNKTEQLEGKTDELQDKMGQLEDGMSEFKNKTEQLEGKTDELQDKMGQLKDRMSEFKNKTEQLKSLCDNLINEENTIKSEIMVIGEEVKKLMLGKDDKSQLRGDTPTFKCPPESTWSTRSTRSTVSREKLHSSLPKAHMANTPVKSHEESVEKLVLLMKVSPQHFKPLLQTLTGRYKSYYMDTTYGLYTMCPRYTNSKKIQSNLFRGQTNKIGALKDLVEQYIRQNCDCVVKYSFVKAL